jgi:hypothetical protein
MDNEDLKAVRRAIMSSSGFNPNTLDLGGAALNSLLATNEYHAQSWYRVTRDGGIFLLEVNDDRANTDRMLIEKWGWRPCPLCGNPIAPGYAFMHLSWQHPFYLVQHTGRFL